MLRCGAAGDQEPVDRALLARSIRVPPDPAGPTVPATHAVLGHHGLEIPILALEVPRRKREGHLTNCEESQSLFTERTWARNFFKSLSLDFRALFIYTRSTKQDNYRVGALSHGNLGSVIPTITRIARLALSRIAAG